MQTLTALQSLLFLSVLLRVRSWLPLVLDGVLPLVLVLPHTLWIPSGKYFLIINHVLSLTLYCSRRMMMTSGSGVNYKSMFDAGSQVRVIRL
jgi:hypothetical protein